MSARPIRAVTVTAWQVDREGHVGPSGCSFGSVAEALLHRPHGSVVAVRIEDVRDRSTVVQFFRIRQGKWQGRVDALGKRVLPLKPDLLCSICVNQFDPVGRWTWSPGADVIGIDRTLIEHGARA